MTIWRMRITCWVSKTTETEYVIFIDFPEQQWLHERASMLRYMYTAWIVVAETGSVYSAVRIKSLNVMIFEVRLKWLETGVYFD
jgi:hypothetical protein